MGYKILNLLAKIFPGLAKLGHEDWQPEDEEPDVIYSPVYYAPPITAEQLYHQDTRKQESDKDVLRKHGVRERLYEEGRLEGPERPAPDRLTRRGLL